ncbi:ATP-dependent Clp protease proteolytic subunit-related protein 4, chloroplastic-like [Phragmites australis]|uniref:ATP-dependent Clp protease proteolytic subunit-related protein 4, chloroplastic-like n=1 Tax=Phragmites australis TaxID=29695 RepID=UPI002D78C306|nr:ATP-dependent Clp protease proteolytic subunit-related protein 4, chloroplastic-like [Phragmites australis]
MEAAAALSPSRVALDSRALFSSPSTLPAPSSPNLRVAACPRVLAAASKPWFLNPHPDPACGVNSRDARDVVVMVVPFLKGTVWEQLPPDLASFLYKNRIVYLGMCLVLSVTELMSLILLPSSKKLLPRLKLCNATYCRNNYKSV